MQLLFSPTSPYVRKCLVAAFELGLADEITLVVSHAHPVKRDASIIAHNPLGKVPTLVLDNGDVLYDSRVIVEYLNEKAGGQLIPQGNTRWAALTLQALADGILDAALLARYETFARPQAYQWTDWVAGQLDKVHTALSALERDPGRLYDVLDGAALHVGHIATGCALSYLDLRFADMAWRERYPKVAAWFSPFNQRPSMQKQW